MSRRDINSINFNDFLVYDESSPTGLRHKVNRRNVKAGSIAGSLHKAYSQVRVDGGLYAVHRVIWQMHHGYLSPDMVVDHIDGDTTNNKIDNLRLITDVMNQRNKRKHKNNRSGFMGVSFNKGGAWVSSWYDESGKQKYKYFYLKDYDYVTAKVLAIKYRETQIATLNLKGFGYTERHGL